MIAQMIQTTESMRTLFVYLAWIITFAATGAYALWVVRKGRRLSALVKPEDRRWM